MKCKSIILLLSIMCTILCLCSCQQKNVHINKEKSFFSDYKVEDGKVYIYCSLVIENPTEAEINVALQACFSDDVKNGLLQESMVDGYLIDGETKTFQLKNGENQLDIVFIGLHAGGKQKHDRTLPDIEIIKVK